MLLLLLLSALVVHMAGLCSALFCLHFSCQKNYDSYRKSVLELEKRALLLTEVEDDIKQEIDRRKFRDMPREDLISLLETVETILQKVNRKLYTNREKPKDLLFQIVDLLSEFNECGMTSSLDDSRKRSTTHASRGMSMRRTKETIEGKRVPLTSSLDDNRKKSTMHASMKSRITKEAIKGKRVPVVGLQRKKSNRLQIEAISELKAPEIVPSLTEDTIDRDASSSTRNLVQVHKPGIATPTSVDVAKVSNMEELLFKLEQVIDFGRPLKAEDRLLEVTFTDMEGHRVDVGNHSWRSFCDIVSDIWIPRTEEEETQIVQEAEIIEMTADDTEPRAILYLDRPVESSSTIHKIVVDKHHTDLGSPVAIGPVNALSVEDAVGKILECMSSGTSRRIGIYGDAGTGKTTLLKALFNHRITNQLFDPIVWIYVSRHPSTTTMQQIAAQLTGSHDFEHQKTLFLLDDVCGPIDWDAVGLPNTDGANGCRIIFTTRTWEICLEMEADTKLKMDLLSGEQPWELFHNQLDGIINAQIEPLARAIAAECGGLPLTINVTANGLRRETDISMWKHALDVIRHCSRLKGTEAIIHVLKFSYDKLESREVKDCFLYFALLQAEAIHISQLITYFISEGILSENPGDASEKGRAIVKVLTEASLLEETVDNCITMHEVIRDLASAMILSNGECRKLLVRTESSQLLGERRKDQFVFPARSSLLRGAGAAMTEPPSNEKWEDAKMIFLMDNDFSELPACPSCSTLSYLFLQRNKSLRAIPDSFFEGMQFLKVLNLSGTRIKSLPRSFFKLKCLNALLLRDCQAFCILPPEIGNLYSLEILDLRGTEIYEMPKEVGNLVHLKHLLIPFYETTKTSGLIKLPHHLIPSDILFRLSRLNELNIAVHPGDRLWNETLSSLISGLNKLEELRALHLYFPDIDLLKQFTESSKSWKSEALTRFNFIVGQNFKRLVARVPDAVEFEYNRQKKCVKFVNGKGKPSAVMEVLRLSTALYLDNHLDIINLSNLGLANIEALEFCILRECSQIQTVVEGGDFPSLKYLGVYYLENLTSIAEGPLAAGSLSELRFLLLHTCPKLTYIFTSSMLQSLIKLEVLQVEDCEAVEYVVREENDINSSYVAFPNLKKLRLHYLPNLTRIWGGLWPPVQHLSFYNCPELRSLYMSSEYTGKIEIQGETDWWRELKWEKDILPEKLEYKFKEIHYEDL